MISFDQYQRYATIGNIIKQIDKFRREEKPLKILEVGANAQKNLEKFISNEIYYTDLEVPSEFENDEHFFVADATNLINIKDDEFDIVVAADVLEHIPPNLREKFICEINRVAKWGTVICFPYKAAYVSETEKRINQYYKSIWNEDYIWLKEHIENGLPDVKEIEKILEDNGLYMASRYHGDIYTWEKMFRAHFYSTGTENLVAYCDKIDEIYNNYIYPFDISEKAYRIFCVITKKQEYSGKYGEIVSRLFPVKQNSNEYSMLLDNAIKDLFFIEEAKKRVLQEKNEYCAARFFYDMGDGYSEEASTELVKVSLDDINYYDFNAQNMGGIKSLRFDPLEGYMCRISELSITDVHGQAVSYSSNGVQFKEEIFFTTSDPQIYIELGDIDSLVTISFRISIAQNRTEQIQISQNEQIINQYSKLEQENESLKQENKLIDQKCKGLEQQKEEIFNEYLKSLQVINAHKESIEGFKIEVNKLSNELACKDRQYTDVINSRTWRYTKAIRVVTGRMRNIKFMRYSFKFFQSIKNNGIKETLLKVKNRRKTRPVIKDKNSLYEIECIEDENILFSIVVPLYNTKINYLEELIESVIGQTYSNWELLLGDASDTNQKQIENICRAYMQKDDRIKYFVLERNDGISHNTNTIISRACGDYIVLCDHDDLLHVQALQANAWVIQNEQAEVIYSDEDHLSVQGKHIAPFYKPDWSPDLLRSQMYTCHLFVFQKALFEEAGGFRSEYDGSQDYDLMLRFSEITTKICHIPLILYSWRECETSTAANAAAKPYAHMAGKKALDDHLKRCIGKGAYAADTDYTFVFDARYPIPENEPMVSIIIPMKDQYILSKQCVESIIEKSTYSNYEILILNNRSEQKETFEWFKDVQKKYSNICVLDADFEFNWSKLNNFGIRHAKGEIYVFLNNDTVVISEDWLERLIENAVRPDVGVVGPLLLYDDDTIQHAGVVIGIGGWADHIFKGMSQVHQGSPYVSPMINRNVLAVTGACMAVSKDKIDKIGVFDEEFIICGSDIELCVRAYNYGYNNLYCANIKLYHLESKSRDSYIPEVDFKKSYECYGPFREYGDPYFNLNLDINSVTPTERKDIVDWLAIKNHLKNGRLTRKMYGNVYDEMIKIRNSMQVSIAEIQPINPREYDKASAAKRINLIVPSVDEKHVFGGIATALSFFEKLCDSINCERRIIVTDADVVKDTMVKNVFSYDIVSSEEDVNSDYQIIPFADRYEKTIPVKSGDIFLATGWWTAYNISSVIEWQKEKYHVDNNLLYLVQDYEPGFYPWSSKYLLADSTYRMKIPTVAIMNSKLLYDFFEKNGYNFKEKFYFEPALNSELKKYLKQGIEKNIMRNKRVMIYGRPGTERNAFPLIVTALKEWALIQEDIGEWEIISAGESFDPIDLGNGKYLKSLGKVSLEEYANLMLTTKAAISLMVSPHPSYPPLEMASFGVRVITNTYDNKDLKDFSENIVSISNCSAKSIAQELRKCCNGEDGKIDLETEYIKGDLDNSWKQIIVGLQKYV